MPRRTAAEPALSVPRQRAIVSRLVQWFEQHQRPLPWRTGYSPYQVWVSEVMLQQTRMDVVVPFFSRFMSIFPDVRSLASAPVEQVLAAWSGLGYYRRARMLHQAARVVMDRHRGNLPADATTLMSIPGIGRYTAGAIGSIAFDLPRPIVDGNIARILARLTAIEAPAGSALFDRAVWSLSQTLVERSRSPRVFNQALMEVGALICRPRNPACNACPVASHCSARRKNAVEYYPRIGRREKTTHLEIPLYVVPDGRGRVLMRRESGRLMSGMFHLPHGSNALFDRSADLKFHPERFLGEFRHTVTHRRIRFQVWIARESEDRVTDSAGEFAWIDRQSLAQIPHPSYVRKALAFLP